MSTPPVDTEASTSAAAGRGAPVTSAARASAAMSASASASDAASGPEPASTSPWRGLTDVLTGWRGDLAALLAGAPLPFAFAPFGWYALAPGMLAVLFGLWLTVSPRRAAWRGFLFGAAGFLAGTYWLYISLHRFGEAPLFIAVPLMLGLVAVMAAYFALAGWIGARLLRPWAAGVRDARGILTLLVAVPAIMVFAEWLRSWLATGFPWFAWGYSQSDSPLIGWAPVLGVFGASLAVASSAGALLLLVIGRGLGPRAAALGALAALWAGGADLRDVPWSVPAGAPVDTVVVQGGVSQDLKWEEAQRPRTKALYLALTEPHWDADLVVWPEAAIPNLINLERPYFDALFERARATDTGLLIGAIQARGPRGSRRLYNSVFAVSERGVTEYHKRHLVPFGEYYPVPGFVRRWMADLGLPYTDFTPGPARQRPLAVAGQSVGVSICYEDVFGSELLPMVPQATVLANVSNDAWFGGSIAPHQHLQIARMRAVEVARPMIRSTNSGISAFIEYDGTVVATTGLFEAEVLRHQVQPREGATPYARFGDAPLLALLTAGLVATWLAHRRRRRRGSAQAGMLS